MDHEVAHEVSEDGEGVVEALEAVGDQEVAAILAHEEVGAANAGKNAYKNYFILLTIKFTIQ